MFLNNYCFVLILVCLYCSCSHGQIDKKFFRKDYKYLESMETFYKFHTLRLNWTEANRMCEAEGANFFYPENDQESTAILSYWNEIQPCHWIFVGISDLVVKGVFETIDGIPVSEVYNNWVPGEPNNAGGVEDCVVWNKQGAYNDDRCSLPQRFLCKKKLSELEWNIPCDIPDLDYTYDEVQRKCYKFHDEAMSWTEAYKVCSAEQSHLAMIDNREEQQLLANLTGLGDDIDILSNGTIHMGFHNRLGLGWRTTKGRRFDYTDFKLWDVDHLGGQNKEEKCGAMNKHGYLCYINCDKKSFFICEHDVNLPPSESSTLPSWLPQQN